MEWAVHPEIFTIPLIDRGIRWYGLLFAMGFVFGYQFVLRIYKNEGRPEKDLDQLLLTVILGTVIGARLGHCLFYEPSVYLRDPIRMLYIWEGGLASHGGVIGICIAVWLYTRGKKDQPFLWIADRIAFPISLAACFIRIGNLFNSEILGRPTDLPWGIYFSLIDAEPVYRHPSMLYESLCYLLTFVVTRHLYFKYQKQTPQGLIIGVMAVMIFTARFFVEFTKENQVSFEDAMTLNMGQILSIPMIALGIFLIWNAKRLGPVTDPAPAHQRTKAKKK